MDCNEKSTYEKGRKFEQLAIDYLVRQGCFVIEYNYRYKGGEIDIIAKDNDIIVFCEVKYRSQEYEEDFCGVDPRKQRRICKGALLYLTTKQLLDMPCRFDVIRIIGAEISWIKNAFEYCY